MTFVDTHIFAFEIIRFVKFYIREANIEDVRGLKL